MRSHKLFAILAVIGFALHLAANLLVDVVIWLPEYIWTGAIVFSVLAIYAGANTAWRGESNERGFAVASAVIGALVLLGLMYSGVYWLFMLGEPLPPAVGAGWS